MTFSRRWFGAFVIGLMAGSATLSASAQSANFTIDKTEKGVSVKVGGQVFADYVVSDAATNKAYLWPVNGPTGKPMTRAFPQTKVEGEVNDHPHHRGICFGHEDIGGWDTWTERATFDMGEQTKPAQKARLERIGNERHQGFKQLKAEADKATVQSEIHYYGQDGKRILTELRTLVFRATSHQRSIDFHQDFIASDGDVTLGDEKDAGLSIRVPTWMSVDSKKGGKIVSSEGLTDAAAWGQKAKWVDYHGPLGDEHLGVAVLNHPSSLRHPTTWHVRTYGLFTANPFGTLNKEQPNGPHTIKAGEKMVLRHRFVLHSGDEKAGKIAEAFEAYAKEPVN